MCVAQWEWFNISQSVSQSVSLLVGGLCACLCLWVIFDGMSLQYRKFMSYALKSTQYQNKFLIQTKPYVATATHTNTRTHTASLTHTHTIGWVLLVKRIWEAPAHATLNQIEKERVHIQNDYLFIRQVTFVSFNTHRYTFAVNVRAFRLVFFTFSPPPSLSLLLWCLPSFKCLGLIICFCYNTMECYHQCTDDSSITVLYWFSRWFFVCEYTSNFS